MAMTDGMTDVRDALPEPDHMVLLYVAYRDAEQLRRESKHGYSYEPEFHVGWLAPKGEEIKADPQGKSNFWGTPIEECKWHIQGWSYFFVPDVLYWCELPPVPSRGNDGN